MIQRKWDLYEIQPIWLRRSIDLQFESIFLELRRVSESVSPDARILDIGAGAMPWRRNFPESCSYVGVDPYRGTEYGVIQDLGEADDADVILLLEVLEHVEDPVAFLKKCVSKMRSGGILVLSVPWSARVHGAPRDFQRWTPDGLRQVLSGAGLRTDEWVVRGSDWTTLCNKIIVAFGRRALNWAWTTVPAWVVGFLVGIPALILGHLSLRMGFGMADDPLGFFVVARKSE